MIGNTEYVVKEIDGDFCSKIFNELGKNKSEKKLIGRYYVREKDGNFVFIDNSEGDAWTEEFTDFYYGIEWVVDSSQDIDHYIEMGVVNKKWGTLHFLLTTLQPNDTM